MRAGIKSLFRKFVKYLRSSAHAHSHTHTQRERKKQKEMDAPLKTLTLVRKRQLSSNITVHAAAIVVLHAYENADRRGASFSGKQSLVPIPVEDIDPHKRTARDGVFRGSFFFCEKMSDILI